jgi:hypothetical protein
MVALFASGALRAAEEITIRESDYEGRPHFVIRSNGQAWWYDRRGGGFSRLIDGSGADWIGFKANPLASYPASAAAGYRGLPNCVFVGDDKGAGHPGFDKCKTEKTGDAQITTTSLSGKWAWRWTFYERYAELEMLKAGAEPWWFLYEGPIAGSFNPRTKYWGTDERGRTTHIPGGGDKHFGNWNTLYVGDEASDRILAIKQVRGDTLPDTYWYLGSSDGGSTDAQDGMVVVGFGRGNKTQPMLRGAGIRFRVALFQSPQWHGHQSTLRAIAHRLTPDQQ